MSRINIQHIATLSALKVTAKEQNKLTTQFKDTLAAVNTLKRLDTGKVDETSQVTGQTNRFRNDTIDIDRMLTPQQALSNAPRTYKHFFMVPAVLDLE